jgi:hypothetical protein
MGRRRDDRCDGQAEFIAVKRRSGQKTPGRKRVDLAGSVW